MKHLSCGLETGKATIHAVIQFVDYDGKSGFHFLVNVSTHAYFGLIIVKLPQIKFTQFGEIGHCVKKPYLQILQFFQDLRKETKVQNQRIFFNIATKHKTVGN